MDFFSKTFSGLCGSQLTALYNNVEERLELLSSFFKEGFEKSEYCLWITSDSSECEKAEVELIAGTDTGTYKFSAQ